eukprot:gene190-803_t
MTSVSIKQPADLSIHVGDSGEPYKYENHNTKGRMNDEKEVVLCPLHQGGCTFKGNRRNLEEHMRSDLETHLFLACRVIKEQNGLIVGYRDKLKQEETEKEQVHKKLDNLLQDFECMKLRYERDRQERVQEAKRIDDKLEIQREYQAHVNDELRLQVHGIKSRIDSSGKATQQLDNKVIAPAQINLSPLLIKQRDQDSKHHLEDSPSSSLHSLFFRPVQHRAELVWRISSFSRKLRKIQSGAHEDPYISEPFTTGPFGYRVSVWVYLNGRGKGASNSVSVYVRIIHGEFDPVLVWPIKPVYTFMLLDQNQDPGLRHNHTRTRDLSIKHGGIEKPKKEEKSVIVGFDDFINHEELEKNNYLVDDSIFIRVLVDIPDQAV